MKTLLHDGQRMIELRRRQDCSASDSVMNFGSPDLALLFLRKCKSDPGSMALLRRFVAYHSDQAALKRMSDHQVLQLLARNISDRQVKVVLHKGSAPSRGGSAQPPIPKPAPPQPKASVARPAPLEPIKPVAAPPDRGGGLRVGRCRGAGRDPEVGRAIGRAVLRRVREGAIGLTGVILPERDFDARNIV
ncbi:MAG: hypothetical protein MPW14_08655 [Candidatus Manganitrophus sp.]|nr:MAG: hypothetical protein MPW14_08655 [Candidatus Manganitrophus sp.]